MKHNLKRKEQGFTIIEVLIVLAIAGLIILIVFLAVPALQRNSRNTQRSNDAAAIGGAFNECISNKNGQITSCDTVAKLEATGLDTTKIRILETIDFDVAFPSDTDSANIALHSRCNPAGDQREPGSSQRQAAVLYRVETQGGNTDQRCTEI